MEDFKIKLEAKLEVYESFINALEQDNPFRYEYIIKANEVKQLLDELEVM